MSIFRKLFSFIGCLGILLNFSVAHCSESDPLTLTATVNQQGVASPLFNVDFVVQNNTDKVLKIWASGCGPNGVWSTDNPAVYSAIICARTLPPHEEFLAPRAQYTGSYPFGIKRNTPAGSLEFRINFKTGPTQSGSAYPDQVFKSNVVQVQVGK